MPVEHAIDDKSHCAIHNIYASGNTSDLLNFGPSNLIRLGKKFLPHLRRPSGPHNGGNSRLEDGERATILSFLMSKNVEH